MLFTKKIYTLIVFSFLILISSCDEKYIIEEAPITDIYVFADNYIRKTNEPITLTAATNLGTNITNNVTFYVDGFPIIGNVFTATSTGLKNVKALYSNGFSEAINITIHNGSETYFKKRVLVEDYTGTWCGWCVRVLYAIEKASSLTNNMVVVGIHRVQSNNPNAGGYDPYSFNSYALETLLNTPGYPKGFLNRRTRWTSPEDSNILQVPIAAQGNNPKLGLAITSNIVTNQINLDVKVKFAKNFSNLKLVVYILENKLNFTQVNYTNYYGAGNIENFEHNHVLKYCATNLLGDEIPANQISVGGVYNRSFNFAVPSNIANANNLEFVAFVVDENGNTLNVRKAGKTEAQTFEEI